MRNLTIIAAVLLSYSVAMAGAGGNGNAITTVSPSVSGIFPHFTSSGNSASQGTQSWQEFRLIAKTNYKYINGQFLPKDSVTYQFSERRGGLPDPDQPNADDHILFDESTTYVYDQPSAQYLNNKHRQQRFADKKVTHLIYQNWHSLSSSWKNAERYVYTYDNSGKMKSSSLELWYGTLWTNSIYSTLTYDNNNNVVEMNSATLEVDFAYDSNNNLVSIEDKVFQQGVGWVNYQRKSYTYTGKDITSYTLDIWLNNTWQHTKKWEYQYDIDKNVIVSIEYEWKNGWENYMMHEYDYDSKGNVLEEVISRWDGLQNIYIKNKKEERTYNYKDQPETHITYSWDGAKWSHTNDDEAIFYYYELYDPTDIMMYSGNYDIKVYPVPASDHINISLPNEFTQNVNVVITDVVGRTVYNNAQDLNNGNVITIPVIQMQPGNYFINLTGNNQVYKQKIAVNR